MDDLRWILLVAAILAIVAIYFFSRSRKKEPSVSPLDAANEVPSFSADKSLDDGWLDGVGPVRVVASSDQKIIDDYQQDEIVEETFVVDDDMVPDSAENFHQVESAATDDTTESPVDNSDINTEIEPVEEPELVTQANSHEAEMQSEAARSEEPAVDDVIAVYVLAEKDGPLLTGDKILSASYALHLAHGDMKIFHRYAESSEKEILFSMANIQEPGWFDIENINQLETHGMSFFMQANLLENPSRVLDDMLICAHRMATMLDATLCNSQRQPLDEESTSLLRDKVNLLVEKRTSQTV